eukprot:2792082-Rhodomonas_salina.1
MSDCVEAVMSGFSFAAKESSAASLLSCMQSGVITALTFAAAETTRLRCFGPERSTSFASAL